MQSIDPQYVSVALQFFEFLVGSGILYGAWKGVQFVFRIWRDHQVERAQALGYPICRCTYPPQIMRKKSVDLFSGDEVSECPRCKCQSPSEVERFKRATKLALPYQP